MYGNMREGQEAHGLPASDMRPEVKEAPLKTRLPAHQNVR